MADNFNILDISPLDTLLARQTVPVSITGTIGEVSMFSTIIPGGLMSKNGIINHAMWFDLPGIGVTIRVKYAGAIIATFTPTQNDYAFGSIVNSNNKSAQTIQTADFNLVPQILVTAVDTTLDQTFEVTYQPSLAPFVYTLSFIELNYFV
jgi:hypothetical protein